MTIYIALLRGINVGGSRKVPMAQLREAFVGAGATDVVTYIQSGNVALRHPARSVDELRVELEGAIEASFGFEVPVVLRTKAQLAAVVEHNPYPTDEPTQLSVVFFNEGPAPGAFDHVDAAAAAPEEFLVRGNEVYLHLPNGMGRAKLPPLMGKALAAGTARNWRTVRKLVDLASA